MSCKSKEKELKKQEFYQMLSSGELGSVEEFMQEMSSKVINLALEEEVSDFLGRERYSRQKSSEREFKGYRNGYQDYTLRTKSGKLKLKKPRVRDYIEAYHSKIIERLNELEESLKNLVLESYVRGLSSRDIEKTFCDENGKPLISRTGVSQLTKQLYEEYKEFSERDLSEYDIVYLFADGVFESIRRYTNNQAILCAWGITSKGEKVMLGISAVNSESYESCKTFFEELKSRGLRQPLLVISDGGKGLKSAISYCFPKSDRQRCIAHKLRNISSKLPADENKEVLNQVKSVYYAPDTETAKLLAEKIVNQYSEKYPSMVKCFMDDFDACIKHLQYPSAHHKYIRTTNLIERTFVEQKRRTKVMPQHQNEKSAVGLVFAVLYRASLDWKKVRMSDFELTLLKNIKKFNCKDSNELHNNFISWTA